MLMHYAWFIWSMLALLLWIIIYYIHVNFRKEMLLVSIWTMPLGLTEPLFVPEYWSPPSLFNLAQKTGFDIESLIFCFSLGGIAAVIYRIFTPSRNIKMNPCEKLGKRHHWHKLILISPIIFFILLSIITNLNYIYLAIISMFSGALLSIYCRPDLKFKVLIGGAIFTIFYGIYFSLLLWILPNYVNHVWNTSELLGIYIFSVPIEEYMFACSFGMLWSSIYEHIFWVKIEFPTKN